jgi:hypothetical protein
MPTSLSYTVPLLPMENESTKKIEPQWIGLWFIQLKMVFPFSEWHYKICQVIKLSWQIVKDIGVS